MPSKPTPMTNAQFVGYAAMAEKLAKLYRKDFSEIYEIQNSEAPAADSMVLKFVGEMRGLIDQLERKVVPAPAAPDVPNATVKSEREDFEALAAEWLSDLTRDGESYVRYREHLAWNVWKIAIRSSADRIQALKAENAHLKQMVAHHETLAMRRGWALLMAREFGLTTPSVLCWGVAVTLQEWVDGGMVGQIPYPNFCEEFDAWGEAHGLANVNGYVGLRADVEKANV